jgi:phosphoserine phosphatase RsbU/P
MMKQFYSRLRARMLAGDLWPQGWVARGALYSLGFAIGLFALEMALKPFAPAAADSLAGWVKFLVFDTTLLFSIVAFRWLKRRILWRLRNRLIVTYVFIGVIPAVLLMAMALITLYGFAGQFAIFVVTSEINSQLRNMEAVNAAVGNELAARLERGDNPTVQSLAGLRKRDAAWSRRRMSAWHGDQLLPLGDDSKAPPLSLPASTKEGLREITRDQGALYLRVVTLLPVGSKTLVVITSEPLDRELVGKIAADMGEISLSDDSGGAAGNKTAPQNSGIKISASAKPEPYRGGLDIRGDNGQLLAPTFTVGTVPAPVNSMDREVTFPGALPVLDWKTGKRTPDGAVIRVWTRPSVLYAHLFVALGDFARGVEYILLGIFIIFTVIVFVALIIGMRMTRTVTGAVAQLDDATKHVDRGDFSHRIPVKSSDQLAQLSLSFNSMTESIEKLILEQKEKQRLEGELAIAQEVQAQLFPRQVTELESLEVHGFCRPARTVSGDYYDFLTASSHKLILAVGDISGKGISAALLMATIHSAVRAYSVESLPQMRESMMRESMMRESVSREPIAVGAVAGAGRIMAARPDGIEVSPGALLGLLNHQLYESTPPEKYATLFLGIYDGRSHRLTYSNGGHLPPILIAKDGAVRRLEAGGTVIGLFDHMTYDEGSVEMHPGEIFLAYSDGVTEPENDFGEFGEERLIDLVSANRRLPLVQISQTVTSAVDDWIGDNEQPDDITLVLARAR